MEKSENIEEIAKALNKFQGEVEGITKDGVNPFFKSNYSTFENVVNTIKGPMTANGLSFAQLPDADGLYTLVMHTSGEWIGAHAALELKGHTPQDQGSAITYMKRYALTGALGLATETDDDGNAATQAVKAKPAAAPVPPKKVEDKRTVQKARIKELVDGIVLVDFTTGEEYKNYILENTGYELVPDNFAQIIDVLEAKLK